MKTVLKKIIPFVVTLALVLSVLTISVAAAVSSVAFSKSTLTVGETLTVTARFSTSSGNAMYGLEGYLTYDPAVLEFVSAGDNSNLLTAGKVKVVLTSAGKTNLSESIKFKTLKAGTSTIALENIVYVNKDEEEKSLTGCSATVTVTNPSTEASSNTNLKGIATSSGTLTPKFNASVTEYNVTIANSVEELWLSVSKGDSKQTYVVEGSRNMKVGLNKRVVVVTAENGDTKRYTVNITRLDSDGQQSDTPTEEEPLNDLSEVTVDDQTMYVVEDFTGAELPEGFAVSEYAFDGKTIPALSDNNYIILLLRLPDNSANNFYVYDKDGIFTQLITITVGGQNFFILPTDEQPEGYSAVNDFTIGEVTVPAYKSDKAGLGDFALVYAKGPGGYTGFYSYDTVDNTLQRVVEVEEEEDVPVDNKEPEKTDIITSFMELNTNGKIVVITILSIIVLLIAAIVVLIIKIATAGKDNYDEYIDQEDELEEYLEDDSGIVDFEYVSVEENNKEEITEEIETTEETEDSEDTEE